MNTTLRSALVVMVLAFGLYACNTYPSTPEEVLAKYLATANSGVKGTSVQYATKSSAATIKQVENSGEQPKGDTADMKIRTAKITGDKAVIPMYNKKTKSLTYYILRKEEDKWKVDLSKEALIETSRLTIEHYGIKFEDIQAGRVSMDSAKKIMDAYMLAHPDGE